MTDQPQFGIDDCTCIPFTRQTNPPRYLNRPTDTVDMISGWERGRDCPHHTPAVPVSSPPPDQTALVDAGAAAIWALYPDAEPSRTGLVLANPHAVAAEVLTVLPPPANRAAVLNAAADFAEEVAEKLRAHHEFERSTGALDVMTELRRLAAEAQQPEPEGGCAHCGSTDHVWDDCEDYTELVRTTEPTPEPPVHKGGNADDCPA